MTICPACTSGNHQHDTYLADGADAGCPNQGVPGDPHSECTCPIRLPRDPRLRRANAHCPTCTCSSSRKDTP